MSGPAPEGVLPALLDGAEVGVAILDADLRFHYVNARMAEFNGVPAEAHVGRTMAETVPDLEATVAPLVAHVLETGRPILSALVAGSTPGALDRHWEASYLPLEAPGGRVVGVDRSADQIAAAKALCGGLPAVEVAVHDLRRLPHADAVFDAAAAVQAIEYLDGPAEGLSELRRVMRAGGRLAVLATNWDAAFWNCGAPELTRRVLDAWRGHAPHPNLPAELRPLLEGAGFRVVRRSPVTILNADLHEDAFAYWAARLMVAFAVGQSLVAPAEGEPWLTALDDAQGAGTFFFSSTPVLTLAVAA